MHHDAIGHELRKTPPAIVSAAKEHPIESERGWVGLPMSEVAVATTSGAASPAARTQDSRRPFSPRYRRYLGYYMNQAVDDTPWIAFASEHPLRLHS
jgi:hypothetical protein